jgi:pimeloyl-ACP methyl ester carboxylesterase
MRTDFIEIGKDRIEVITYEPHSDAVAAYSSPTSNEPMVFLHEGLGCAKSWKDFPQRVANATDRSAVVYSRAGYGGSSVAKLPRTIDYMHHEATISLPLLLRTLNIHRPYLVGHSDGASIALITAAVLPHQIQGVVALAPHVFVEEQSIVGIREAKENALHGTLLTKLARFHNDPNAAFWGWNDIWLHPDFRSWDIRPILPQIVCRVLAIQGHQDEYGTVAQLDTISSIVANSKSIMLDQCAHAPHREHSDAVLSHIVDFVGDC